MDLDQRTPKQASSGALKKFTKSNHSLMDVTLQQLNSESSNVSSSNTTAVNEVTIRNAGACAWQNMPKQHFDKTGSPFGSVTTSKSMSYASKFLKTSWPELQHRSLSNQEKVHSKNTSKSLTFANMVKDGDLKSEQNKKREQCKWDSTINSRWSNPISNNQNTDLICDGVKDKTSYYSLYKNNTSNTVIHHINVKEINGTCSDNVRTEDNAFLLKEATNIAGKSTDSEDTVLDRKARRNIKKIRMKEEKRRAKEEEVRRKLVAPKDHRVRLVDHSLLKKIANNNEMAKVNMCKILPVNNEHFPILGDTKRPARDFSFRCTNDSKPQSVDQDQGIQRKIETEDSPTVRIESVPQKSEILQEGNSKSETKVMLSDDVKNEQNHKNKMLSPVVKPVLSAKKPRRKDPIKIDILQAIKNLKVKHQRESTSSVASLISKVHRLETFPRDYGNQLDSSNPERKRGKMRDIPKRKRLSRLKTTILAERSRRHQRSEFLLISSLKALCITSHGLSALDETSNHPEADNTNKEELSQSASHCIKTESDTDPSKGSNCGSLLWKAHCVEQTDPDQHQLNVSPIHSEHTVGNRETVSDTSCLIRNTRENVEQYNGENAEETLNLSSKNCNTNKDIRNSVTVNVTTLKADKLLLGYDGSSTLSKETSELPTAQSSIHSRKFRDYCDHSLTPELNAAITAVVRDVVKFHDRQYQRDPLKANAKRRHVVGLKEVKKFLDLKRLKLIVIAPDLEKVQAQGGLDELVGHLKELAIAQQVPYAFALGRRQLGRLTFKKVPVSCLGVLNYEGTESNFQLVLAALTAARAHYQAQMGKLMPIHNADVNIPESDHNTCTTQEDCSVDVNKQVIASLLAKLTEKEPAPPETPFLRALNNQSFRENDGSDSDWESGD